METWYVYLFPIILGFCKSADGRQGRMIFLNTDNSIDIALQAIVPFGVALPMVKKESRQGRRTRTEDKFHDHDHPVYGIHLARLDNYFDYLEVENEFCRQKLLCELAENPEEFYPIADIFFKQIELWVPENEDGRYSQYVTAAQHGVLSAMNGTSAGTCENHFSSCSFVARKIFDMDAINFWKFLSTILHFKIGA